MSQYLRGVRTRSGQRREQSKQQTCQHRYSQSEEQNAAIKRGLVQPRHGSRINSHEKSNRGERHPTAQRTAAGGQEERLSQELANQTWPPGAQRGPHAHFANSASCTSHRQACHIAAGNKQQQRHGSHQEEQGVAWSPSHGSDEWYDQRAKSLIFHRAKQVDLCHELAHFCLCLFEGNSLTQP